MSPLVIQRSCQPFTYTCSKWPKEKVIRNSYACEIIGSNSYYANSTYDNQTSANYRFPTHFVRRIRRKMFFPSFAVFPLSFSKRN